MTTDKKPSPLEEIKEASQFLRGGIAAGLVDDTDHFSSADVQLLKFHGMYQQDDRDVRMAARKAGQSGKRYMFLVRTRVPGGRLPSEQLLAELDLCDEVGNGTLRITSRQSLQLHGILKSHLRDVIRRINAVQLTTFGACGDGNRNVMCCPAPYTSRPYGEMQALTQKLASHFTARTRAYREIWLQDVETGEKDRLDSDPATDDDEPLYGRTYLPRKFKMAIALPDDNCIDVHTHDLGMLAIVEDDRIIGYNLLVGGGMGVTPSNKNTFPALGQKFAFVSPDQVVDVAEAVVRVQRDFGNRTDRKTARLKYLIHNWGLEAFRSKVEEYYGRELVPAHDLEVCEAEDHIGWTDQGDGRWCYGLNIENGRIADTEAMQLKTAVRQLCSELSPEARLTAHQSLLLTGIAEQQRDRVEEVLRNHGVVMSADVSTVRRWSMACVALPTCGLAVTESERALPGIMDAMERELDRLGLSGERFTVRMTGCPNGCVRPYNADIGLVGKAKGRYTVFLGGTRLGTRLNFIFKNLVPAEEIVPLLVPLFVYFQQQRSDGESFGDFCHRKGCADLQARCECHETDAG